MLRADQKIVIVTRATQMGELRRKFATPGQAKFRMVSARKRALARESSAPASDIEAKAEAVFDEVVSASAKYDESLEKLRSDLGFDQLDVPVQMIDRGFLPNFVFGAHDVIVTVGQDGLVANTAKYALGLPIIAVNPDPLRIDGVLLPFRPDQAAAVVRSALAGKAKARRVTLAEAVLDDGQKLLAFNDLFIGCRSHVSARYRLSLEGRSEPQSSSGMIVSTGAGSTGWLSSVFNMARGVLALRTNPPDKPEVRLAWEDPRLCYVVREPFISKSSRATIISGFLEKGRELVVESDMSSNGVIFSDGIESDFLEFNAGAVARIRASNSKALLVTG
jgi:NAD kinase